MGELRETSESSAQLHGAYAVYEEAALGFSEGLHCLLAWGMDVDGSGSTSLFPACGLTKCEHVVTGRSSEVLAGAVIELWGFLGRQVRLL